MTGLLTDLYELTMAAGYFETGRSAERNIRLSVAQPRNRSTYCGGNRQASISGSPLHRAEIDYLRTLPQFERVSGSFFEQLREFLFTECLGRTGRHRALRR